MAEDSGTIKVRMLRTSGSNKEIQWFEYRPSFRVDIVRIEWEHDTDIVELDSPVADYLLRAGYAAPIQQGSAPVAPKPIVSPPPAPPAPVTPSPKTKDNQAEESSPPPPAPAWLKPSGDD